MLSGLALLAAAGEGQARQFRTLPTSPFSTSVACRGLGATTYNRTHTRSLRLIRPLFTWATVCLGYGLAGITVCATRRKSGDGFI
jgi:hypothetical protein